jgi:hypothetical protein
VFDVADGGLHVAVDEGPYGLHQHEFFVVEFVHGVIESPGVESPDFSVERTSNVRPY